MAVSKSISNDNWVGVPKLFVSQDNNLIKEYVAKLTEKTWIQSLQSKALPKIQFVLLFQN
jgi:hypothetical protein